MKGAWVTLATNDSYSLGALVLAHSLKQVGTTQELALLVTPGVTSAMRTKLSQIFDVVLEVNVLDSKDKANLKLLQRPELGVTFTKLHCWRLTQYEKCVFLDADTLVLRNCDELFEREELSAAPDVGWPDCFNSGVFVYKPSDETYDKLIQFALAKGSFDGGDQGLLNLYFADWSYKDISKHLPFIYNVCSTAFYSYLPAFKQFGKDVKIIHFIGNAKPWLQYFDTETRKVRPSGDLSHLGVILQKWWDIFCTLIHPNLSSEMSGLAGAFAKLTLGQRRSSEQEALEDNLRRQNWEQGNIDYLGKDSFDNIWSKICETLAKGPQAEPEEEQVSAVIQPEIPEPKLTTEKTTAAAPQEEKQSVQTETRDPVEPQQQTIELPVEIKTEPSQTSTSESAIPSISEGSEKNVVTPIETPAVTPISSTSGAVSESIPEVIPINAENPAAASVIEQPVVETSQVEASPTTLEPLPESSPLLSENLVVSAQTEVDKTKTTPVEPPQPEILPVAPPKSAIDTNLTTKVETLLPELSATCSAPETTSRQTTSPSSSQIPTPPIQPTAPAAELVGMPQICPLQKPSVGIPVEQKTESAPVIPDVSQNSAEITEIPDISASTQPISSEIPTTKLQMRATSVQIPADIASEPNVTSELPAQEETPTSLVQTPSVVPIAQKQPDAVPVPQPSVEAALNVALQSSAPIPTDAPIVEAKASAIATETSQTSSPIEMPIAALKGQIPASTAETSIETPQPQKEQCTEATLEQTQVAQNPEATCPQPPIAPPPRKSGGNKKQGKSKK